MRLSVGRHTFDQPQAPRFCRSSFLQARNLDKRLGNPADIRFSICTKRPVDAKLQYQARDRSTSGRVWCRCVVHEHDPSPLTPAKIYEHLSAFAWREPKLGNRSGFLQETAVRRD